LKKKTQKKRDIPFKLKTDTEVIAHLIEKYFQGSIEEATRQAVQELEGAYAIAAFSTQDAPKIVATKVGPPAVIGLGEGEYFVSSDINPLLSHTQQMVFLDDGELAVIEPGGVRFSDFKGSSLEKKVDYLTWTPLMIEKEGFKHFMLKEIFEQPQVVRDTIAGRISLDSGKMCLDEIGVSAEFLKKIERVVIIACGTSFHAGLIGKYFIETLAEIPVDIEYASEYRYRDFILDKETLVLVISQSGETADVLAALRAAKERGAVPLAICNVKNSSIAREAEGILYTHAGPEIGVAATKTFSAQMAALALLALHLAQQKEKVDEKINLSLIEDLKRIPHRMERILNQTSSIEKLARKFVSFSHILYLGRWISYPIALEGALKLKEISYIHAEGYPGGEMKHGPIALIDEKMPTLVIAPKDRVYEKMMSNISEIKTRLGYILAIAFEDDEEIQDKVDQVIPIPSVNPLFTPFLTTIPVQLFAYYIAAMRGADVDQPRNLAKSVTVE